MRPHSLFLVCVAALCACLVSALVGALWYRNNLHRLTYLEIALASSGYLPVVRSMDGDTLAVELRFAPVYTKGRKVISIRLAGVDTPEIGVLGRPAECYGVEAAAFTKRLVEGRRAKLYFDRSFPLFDSRQRLVAYVYLENGVFLNQKLIEEGYAEEWTYRVKTYDFQAEFQAAEQKARTALVGRWGVCGLQSKKH